MEQQINIGTNNTSAISISGTVNQKEEMRVIFIKAKALLQQYNGRILRSNEFEDGFFLEAWFANEQVKRIWENTIKMLTTN